MDDAGVVGGLECVCHLRNDAGDLGNRDLPATDSGGEGLALVIRHRNERLPGVAADLVNGGDVRVVEGAGRTGFANQASRGVTAANLPGGKELESDLALQIRI